MEYNLGFAAMKRSASSTAMVPVSKATETSVWQQRLSSHSDMPERVKIFIRVGIAGELGIHGDLIWNAVAHFRQEQGIWPDIHSNTVRRRVFDIACDLAVIPQVCRSDDCNWCRTAGCQRTKGLAVRTSGHISFHTIRNAVVLAREFPHLYYGCSVKTTPFDDNLLLMTFNPTVCETVRKFYRHLQSYNIFAGMKSSASFAHILILRLCLGGKQVEVNNITGRIPCITLDTWLNTELDHSENSDGKVSEVSRVFDKNGILAGFLELMKTTELSNSQHNDTHRIDRRDIVAHIVTYFAHLDDFNDLTTSTERKYYFTRWDNPGGILPWRSEAESDKDPAFRGMKFLLDKLGLVVRKHQRASDENNQRMMILMLLAHGGKCSITGCECYLLDLEANHLFDVREKVVPNSWKKLGMCCVLGQRGRWAQCWSEMMKSELLCRSHHIAWSGRKRNTSVHVVEMFRRARVMCEEQFPDALYVMPQAWTPQCVKYLDVCYRDISEVRKRQSVINGNPLE